jgi:hypothetical protein
MNNAVMYQDLYVFEKIDAFKKQGKACQAGSY